MRTNNHGGAKEMGEGGGGGGGGGGREGEMEEYNKKEIYSNRDESMKKFIMLE